jgi:hypothetical protein
VSHELIDEISLELGRRTAARLRQQPELLQLAQENLARWSRLNANAPALLRCYEEWREILQHPLTDICQLLSSESEAARLLRQNSPFAGVLSAREVWELKERFRHATTAA